MLKTLARLFRQGAAVASRREAVAESLNIEPPGVLLAPCIAALDAGREHEAADLIETLLESHPDLAEAHLLLGTIRHRQRNFEDARDSYLLAACFKPQWWRAQFQLGLLELDEQNFADAAQALRKALALEANDARVHNALGSAHLHMRDVSAAVDAFRKAVALEPGFAHAHSNLGYVLFKELEQYEEGARHIERALELAPSDTGALCNRIMLLHHRGRTDEALALADQLLARDDGFAEARLNRALMLLAKGEFERGWTDYEARKRASAGTCSSDFPAPEWDGSPLTGRSIFVYPEQGLGDEIMFASCLPDLLATGAACSIECDPKLESLFRRSFPRAEILAKDAWRASDALAARPPEVKVAIGSLPRFFRRTRAQFPSHGGYLRVDRAKVARWKTRLDALPCRRKVGISWRGGLASTKRSLRSIALDDWTPVLTVPGVDFVSLQYSDSEREIEALRATGIDLHAWPDAIEDYDETAALVASLDLVISIQTAIVHLAGAVGTPAWALISAAPEWRYGAAGASMVWYPSVRLLRQSVLARWDGVIAAVASELRAWAEPPRT